MLCGLNYEGDELHAALKGDEDSKLHRRTRLIVRNLPWSINEEKMEKVFHKFGTVTEVKLPKKEDGRLRGFGFVQFSHGHESAKAIKDKVLIIFTCILRNFKRTNRINYKSVFFNYEP